VKATGGQTENSEWMHGALVSMGTARCWAVGVEVSASGWWGRK